jgi:hypothetical protein
MWFEARHAAEGFDSLGVSDPADYPVVVAGKLSEMLYMRASVWLVLKFRTVCFHFLTVKGLCISWRVLISHDS